METKDSKRTLTSADIVKRLRKMGFKKVDKDNMYKARTFMDVEFFQDGKYGAYSYSEDDFNLFAEFFKIKKNRSFSEAGEIFREKMEIKEKETVKVADILLEPIKQTDFPSIEPPTENKPPKDKIIEEKSIDKELIEAKSIENKAIKENNDLNLYPMTLKSLDRMSKFHELNKEEIVDMALGLLEFISPPKNLPNVFHDLSLSDLYFLIKHRYGQSVDEFPTEKELLETNDEII